MITASITFIIVLIASFASWSISKSSTKKKYQKDLVQQGFGEYYLSEDLNVEFRMFSKTEIYEQIKQIKVEDGSIF